MPPYIPHPQRNGATYHGVVHDVPHVGRGLHIAVVVTHVTVTALVNQNAIQVIVHWLSLQS